MGKHSSHKERPASFTDDFDDFCVSPILKQNSSHFDNTPQAALPNINNFLPENEDQDMDIDHKDWLEGEPVLKDGSSEPASKGSKQKADNPNSSREIEKVSTVMNYNGFNSLNSIE